MRALYDTGRYLTSFNFFEWLLQAQGLGATSVVFDIRNIRGDKWPTQLALRRFWSILWPGPPLIGLPRVVFEASNDRPTKAKDICKPGGAELVRFWRKHGQFKRLKSVLPPGKAKYTVTLRQTQRAPARDSNALVWREFAAEIGAKVIEDYDVQQIGLHERMALYAGAEMNFFVSNGPGLLCSFSEYPCMLFNTVDAKGSLLADGLTDGCQYPWMLENQRTIWEHASPEALRRHFYTWRSTGRFAEDGYKPTPAA